MERVESIVKSLVEQINNLDLDEKVSCLNYTREALHKISPFKKEPVDFVRWVPSHLVRANDYNPNSVAPPEMRLLELSIQKDGYTQPIVGWKCESDFEVVDGFHRNRVGKESEKVAKRIQGYLPIVSINESVAKKGDRVSSTIRHNRARGKHRVDAMSEIVVDLKRRNWSDKKIGKELGMDPDEVLRLAQISGLAEMFADKDFSMAWEVNSINETDSLSDFNAEV